MRNQKEENQEPMALLKYLRTSRSLWKNLKAKFWMSSTL